MFAVDCTVGAEGLYPTLIVFGAIPGPSGALPTPSQLERAKIIDCVIDEVVKEQAVGKMASALKHKGSPDRKSTWHCCEIQRLAAQS